MKTLFITGTDTGVGKTLVTALLALHFQKQGINCGVMKPFASGCAMVNGELISEDAQFLKNATGVKDELNLINPIRLQEPLAPLMAARRAAIDSSKFFAQAQTSLKILQAHYELVSRSAGGLLAPLCEQEGRILTCLDLIEAWQMPVVIVARRTLGTINHTLLTIETLRAKANIEGLVFCDAEVVSEDDIAAQSSPELIAEITGLPIWGRVPYLQQLTPDSLPKAAQKYLDIPK